MLVGTAVWSHFKTPVDPSTLDGQETRIVRVIDGDTVVVSGNGLTDEHVRLRGIDAPELVHPGLSTDAHFGRESKANLARLLPAGQAVTMKFDGTEKRDRYQRMLAYLYVGDSDCVNVDQVESGMAYVDRRFKTMLQSDLDAAETQARTKKAGLWKDVKPDDMPAWRQKWLAKKKLSPDD